MKILVIYMVLLVETLEALAAGHGTLVMSESMTTNVFSVDLKVDSSVVARVFSEVITHAATSICQFYLPTPTQPCSASTDRLRRVSQSWAKIPK